MTLKIRAWVTVGRGGQQKAREEAQDPVSRPPLPVEGCSGEAGATGAAWMPAVETQPPP